MLKGKLSVSVLSSVQVLVKLCVAATEKRTKMSAKQDRNLVKRKRDWPLNEAVVVS